MELRKQVWKGVLILLVATLLRPQNTVAHPYQVFQFGENDPNFRPVDIVTNGTHFFIANSPAAGGNYQIYLRNGTYVSTVNTLIPIGWTGGLYHNGSNILILDQTNNKVKVYDMDGVLQNQFGPEDGSFNYPKDIEMDATHIFVTDTYRLNIFNSSGDLVKKIPEPAGYGGSGDGEFAKPLGIALNNTHIHVADYFNGRIQIFDINANYVSQFPVGIDVAGGTYPTSVTLTSDFIVVSVVNEYSQFPDSIEFYDYLGNFIIRIGNPLGTGNNEFADVRGMINNGTHLFVADQAGWVSFIKLTPFFTTTETQSVTETNTLTETTTVNNTLTETETSTITENSTITNNVTITNPVTDIVSVTETQPGVTEVVIITEVPPPITENYTQTVNGTTTSTIVTTLVDRVTTEITNGKSEASWALTPLLLAPIVMVYLKRRK